MHYVVYAYEPSSRIISTAPTEHENHFMAFGSQWRYITAAPPTPFMSKNTRPGWITCSCGLRRKSLYADTAQQRGLICNECYDRGNVSPECAHPVRQMRKILEPTTTSTRGQFTCVGFVVPTRSVRACADSEAASPMEGPSEPETTGAIRGSQYGDLHYARWLNQPETRNLCAYLPTCQDHMAEVDPPQYYKPESQTQGK